MADHLALTPARKALLDDIDAGRVIRDEADNDYVAGGVKVNDRVREMQDAGWCDVASGGGVRTWALTPYGRGVKSVRLMDWGHHMVAETGDADDPLVLGEAAPATHRRWAVHVGETALVRTKHAARLELRHMAALVLAESTVQEGQTS